VSPDISGLTQGVARAEARAREVNHAWALARRAWDAGMSVHELSRLLGVERSTIRRYAKRYGWPTRAPGRRAGPRGAISLTCQNCGTGLRLVPRVA
jgi:hypothetical protein